MERSLVDVEVSGCVKMVRILWEVKVLTFHSAMEWVNVS